MYIVYLEVNNYIINLHRIVGAIANAGPEMQARLLKGLGLKVRELRFVRLLDLFCLLVRWAELT